MLLLKGRARIARLLRNFLRQVGNLADPYYRMKSCRNIGVFSSSSRILKYSWSLTVDQVWASYSNGASRYHTFHIWGKYRKFANFLYCLTSYSSSPFKEGLPVDVTKVFFFRKKKTLTDFSEGFPLRLTNHQKPVLDRFRVFWGFPKPSENLY